MPLIRNHTHQVTCQRYPRLVCPNCKSRDLHRVSLLYAAGLYQSRGSLIGHFLRTGNGILLGRLSANTQTLLSKKLAPPRKAPYLAPAVPWLLGFFVVMAFAGRGKLSPAMTAISFAYLVALPIWLVLAFFHNLLLHPRKFAKWRREFQCQQCGHHTSIPRLTVATRPHFPNDRRPNAFPR
jgi:hypothetical protein